MSIRRIERQTYTAAWTKRQRQRPRAEARERLVCVYDASPRVAQLAECCLVRGEADSRSGVWKR